MILLLTGFKAALAAEIVSFWICINAALFDLFSPAGLPSAEGRDTGGVAAGDAAAVDADEVVGAGVGSAVIRSISVVPDESCTNPKLVKNREAIKLVRISKGMWYRKERTKKRAYAMACEELPPFSCVVDCEYDLMRR